MVSETARLMQLRLNALASNVFAADRVHGDDAVRPLDAGAGSAARGGCGPTCTTAAPFAGPGASGNTLTHQHQPGGRDHRAPSGQIPRNLRVPSQLAAMGPDAG